MAEPPGRRRMRGFWLRGVALALALLGGVVYYVSSVGTQPSLVSGEGADRVSPEEAETEALGTEEAEAND